MTAALSKPFPRGVALIEEVIQRLEKDNSTMRLPWPQGRPIPLPSDQLSQVTFANGQPLSSSLRRWLSFECSWLGWFADSPNIVLNPESLAACRPHPFAHACEIFSPLLSGDLYRLPLGDCTVRYLYVGQSDVTGEYPVIFTDTDDRIVLGLEFPGFDVYIAWAMGTHPQVQTRDLWQNSALIPSLQAHADANLHGYRLCDLYGEAILADGRKGRWHTKQEDDILAFLGLSPEDTKEYLADLMR